jgi:hypothetical protein
MRRRTPTAIGLSLLVLATGCPGPTPDATPSPSPSAAQEDPAAFSETRAWDHLRALCGMGPRAHATTGWEEAQQYIRDHLRACGVEPRDVRFDYPPHSKASLVNITARFRGARDDAWVLIGSHYDTRLWADEDEVEGRRQTPIEGANDGGSGTAVLLELATVFSRNPPPVSVELVFFDGEDFGRRGSKHYMLGSKDMAARWQEYYPDRPTGAIVLDMVGDLDLRFLREQHADEDHAWLNDVLWQAAQQAGYADTFASEQLRVWDDHTALIEAGIPATLLIDFTYPYWHTAGDTLDKCSKRSLRVTGEVLLQALENPRLRGAEAPLGLPEGPR